MKRLLIFSAALLSAVLCAETVEFKTKADFVKGAVTAGEDCLRSPVPGGGVEGKSFAVDPKRKIRLSGEFRAGKNSGGKIDGILFGFVPYDAGGRQIVPEAVRPVNTGIFTLAQEVKAGDRTLKIKGDPKIINTAHIVVAFDAKGDLSDLPNYQLSPRLDPKSVRVAEGVISVALREPMKFGRPAGTPVRFHSLDAMHIYTCGKIVPTEQWQTFSGEISGAAVRGVPRDRWWHGTKSAAPMFRYVGSQPRCELEFRNIRVEIL